jgi:hypothetical protein
MSVKTRLKFYFGAVKHVILYWLQWRPNLEGAAWMEREFPECTCQYCKWYEVRGGTGAVTIENPEQLLKDGNLGPPYREVLNTLTAKLENKCPACNGTIVMQDTVKLDQQDGTLIPYHVHCLPSRSQS